MINDKVDILMHESEVAREIVAATINRNQPFRVIFGRPDRIRNPGRINTGYTDNLSSTDIVLPGKRNISKENLKVIETLFEGELINIDLEYIDSPKKPTSLTISGLIDTDEIPRETLRIELKDYLKGVFPNKNLVHELFEVDAMPYNDKSFDMSYSIPGLVLEAARGGGTKYLSKEVRSGGIGQKKSIKECISQGKKLVLARSWNNTQRDMIVTRGHQVQVLGTTSKHDSGNSGHIGDLTIYTSFDPREDNFFSKAIEDYQKNGIIFSGEDEGIKKVGLFYSGPVNIMNQVLGRSYHLQHFKTLK